uniref:Uncharacterized protein n=1 Tax=Rhodnius prolixus TaxID=13249 RepID=T1IAN9_RHOPR
MPSREQGGGHFFVDPPQVKAIVSELTQDYSDNTILNKLKGKDIAQILSDYTLFYNISNKLETKHFVYSVLKAIELERKDRNKLKESMQMSSGCRNKLYTLNEDIKLNDLFTNNIKSRRGFYFLNKLNCLNAFKQFFAVKEESQRNLKRKRRNIVKSSRTKKVGAEENEGNAENHVMQPDQMLENDSNYLGRKSISDTCDGGSTIEVLPPSSSSSGTNLPSSHQLLTKASFNKQLVIMKILEKRHWPTLISTITKPPIIHKYRPKSIANHHLFTKPFIARSTQTSEPIISNVFLEALMRLNYPGNIDIKQNVGNDNMGNDNVDNDIVGSNSGDVDDIDQHLDWNCLNSTAHIYEMCLDQLKVKACADERVYSSSNWGSLDSRSTLTSGHLLPRSCIPTRSNGCLTLKQLHLHLNGKVKNNIKYFNQQNVLNSYHSNLDDDDKLSEINRFKGTQNIFESRVSPGSSRTRLFNNYSDKKETSFQKSVASESEYISPEKCENSDSEGNEVDSLVQDRGGLAPKSAPELVKDRGGLATKSAPECTLPPADDLTSSLNSRSLLIQTSLNYELSKSLVLYNVRNSDKHLNKRKHSLFRYNKNEPKCTIS